jgi:hypothetical protein
MISCFASLACRPAIGHAASAPARQRSLSRMRSPGRRGLSAPASRSPNGFGARRPRKTEEENPELPLLVRIDHIVAEIKQISRTAKHGIRQ